MSRVILSKYSDGGSHVVVGWDHPAGGAFWQEFASKSEIEAAENWFDENRENPERFASEEALQMERIADTEVKREGGMFPGIKLADLRASMPEDLQPLITDHVLDLLSAHSEDPNSGYGPQSTVDLA